MATLDVDAWALRKITLDKADGVMPSPLIANAADANGRGIMLSVVQGGAPANLTGCKVYLLWSHENGNQDMTEFKAVSASEGRFKAYYPPAMMHGGKVEARISVYMGETLITGSRNFAINVERNPIDEDEAMADESFTAFTQAVIDLNTARTKAEAATSAANSATKRTETAISNASAATSAANNAADAAESAASKATTAAGAANTAASSASNAATTANSSASAADAAADRANAAADRVDSTSLIDLADRVAALEAKLSTANATQLTVEQLAAAKVTAGGVVIKA